MFICIVHIKLSKATAVAEIAIIAINATFNFCLITG